MVRLFRALCAVAALASVALTIPAQAQSSRIRVEFRNNTDKCPWITFYKRDASGIGGTLAPPQIISENRSQTGPGSVHPHATYNFSIPRVRWLRLRVEPENRCGSGAIYDTQFTLDNVSNLDVLTFTLHRGSNNYYITRP